jgi:hypothetical protein
MVTRVAIYFWLVISVIIFFPGISLSSGIGFSYISGSGKGDWKTKKDNTSWGWTSKADRSSSGLGIFWDTNIGENRFFNYRLGLESRQVKYEIKNSNLKYDLDSLALLNSFGFSLWRSEHHRIWFGPQIIITKLKGFVNTNPDWKIDLLGLGIGPVLGLNLNLNSKIAFAATTSYILGDYSGDGNDNRHYIANSSYDVDKQGYFSLSLSLIYRFEE